MTSTLTYILVSALIFSLIDFVWLGFIAKKLYQKYIGFLLRDKPDMVAAVVFYALYIIGLNVFVIAPATNANHPVAFAAGYGALYGLFTYATYDLTNQATVKGWPLKITLIDLTWGMAISAVTAAATLQLLV